MSKLIIAALFISGAAWAQAPAAGKGNHPCVQIENDCKGKGYIAGEAGEGKGLWWDCMCPLIAPNFPEPKKNVLTPPSDQALAAECRTKPHGEKIVQRCEDMLAKKNAKAAAKH